MNEQNINEEVDEMYELRFK